MDYPDEVSHPRMFRWLTAKSNTNIKEVDLFNPPDDAVVHPWIMPTEEESVMNSYITLGHVDTIADPTMELIKKELVGVTAIRRAVRQGQPNVEALHEQHFTMTDLGASSGGVLGVGGSSHPSSPSCSRCECDEYKDRQDKLFEKLKSISKATEEFKFKRCVIPSKKSRRSICTRNLALKRRGICDRPNPHGKSWTETKKILVVISVNGIHYRVVEILLEEGNINVYDSNVPLIDDFDLFLLVEPLMVLLPILLRESKLMNHLSKEVLMTKSWNFEGRNGGMILPKDDAAKASDSHALAHIECLLTDTEMAELMTFLCDNAVANLQ
ncbi:hypothetical protein P3S67_006918 [Capsicum chacoense]